MFYQVELTVDSAVAQQVTANVVDSYLGTGVGVTGICNNVSFILKVQIFSSLSDGFPIAFLYILLCDTYLLNMLFLHFKRGDNEFRNMK